MLDAKALGDPGVLGAARLSLMSLRLVPNSPPLNLWLPLEVLTSSLHESRGNSIFSELTPGLPAA